MKSRENYWYWMLQNIKFARYDRQFITEVYNRRIAKNRAVTPKQAELWEKLVYRYRQQIEQANLDPDAMLAAAWAVMPLPPTADHERSQLSLQDDHLIMRSPYDRAQVDAWADYRRARDLVDDAVWDPDAKEWIIPVTAKNLRSTLEFCRSRTPAYDIDARVNDLLDPVLSASEADQWTVQARLVNGGIMINCANQHVMAAIPEHLPLTLTTLNTLVRAGVEIHEDLRSYFCSNAESVVPAMLNSQQATALTWSEDNHQAILDYIDQHEQHSVAVELINEQDAYHDLCQDIQQRWPNRVSTYYRARSRNPEWEFMDDYQYNYQAIDFDSVDIVINKSRGLVVWDVGSLPAQIARKIIYYIDPQYHREDYLDGNTSW